MPGNRFFDAARRAGDRSSSGIDVTGRVHYAEGRAISVEVYGRVLQLEADGQHLRVGQVTLELRRVGDRELLVER